jgi:hypothetical protein
MQDEHVPRSQSPAYQDVPGEVTDEPDAPASLLFSQFPLHTAPGVRAAWKFITNPENADRYSHDDVIAFKELVKQAARQTGVNLHDD